MLLARSDRHTTTVGVAVCSSKLVSGKVLQINYIKADAFCVKFDSCADM